MLGSNYVCFATGQGMPRNKNMMWVTFLNLCGLLCIFNYGAALHNNVNQRFQFSAQLEPCRHAHQRAKYENIGEITISGHLTCKPPAKEPLSSIRQCLMYHCRPCIVLSTHYSDMLSLIIQQSDKHISISN